MSGPASEPRGDVRVLEQPDLLKQSRTGRAAAAVVLRPGDIVGDLRLLHDEEPSPSGARRARFRCECGAEVIRYASNVLQVARRGTVVSCTDCYSRLRRLKRELESDLRRQAYRRRWLNTGRLYSARDDERIARQVLEDLEREVAPVRDTDAEHVIENGFWFDPTWTDTPPPKRTDTEEERRLAEADFARDVQKAHQRRLDVWSSLGSFVADDGGAS